MSLRFEELDWRETPMGAVSLRRRREPALQVDLYEVKLGDEFLMSSLFTAAEVALARLALRSLPGTDLDVVVGGLGLGYTANAVLEDPRVNSLTVVEALDAVIDWHVRGLLPDATQLTSDPRARIVHGDFFELARAGTGFDRGQPGRRFDAVLVDIDHTPSHLLNPAHAPFYTASGLRDLTGHLSPGGVFGLWSDDSPDPDFRAVLTEVFDVCEAHMVTFPNPLTGGEASNTVYLTRV